MKIDFGRAVRCSSQCYSVTTFQSKCPMKKCRLIYKSKATSHLMEAQNLQSLAEKASVANLELGITGLLLLTGNQILQVLEGPCRFVNQLYPKIVNDTRHTDVELISYQSLDGALFYDWNMRFLDLRKLSPSVHALFLMKYPHDGDTITVPQDLVTTLSLLIDAKNIGLTAEKLNTGIES